MINEIAVVSKNSKLKEKNLYLFGDREAVAAFSEKADKYRFTIKAFTLVNGDFEHEKYRTAEAFFEQLNGDNNAQLIVASSEGKIAKLAKECEGKTDKDVCSAYAAELYGEVFLPSENEMLDELEKFYRVYNRNKSTCTKLINALKEPSVLVYQRCKVGSTTICHSLDKLGEANIHLHQMNFNKANKFFDCRLYGDRENLTMFDGDEKFIRAYIEALKQQGKVRIVTAVRNPIARDFSEFFQALDWPSFERYRMREEGLDLQEACLSYMLETAKISQPVWFDEQIKDLFGVDIFKYPFDKEKGYAVIKENNVEIFVFKLEKLFALEKELADFFGRADFKLINANTAKDKASALLYVEAKRKVSLPEEMLRFYEEGFGRMSHFYSEEEKKAFLDEWKGNR